MMTEKLCLHCQRPIANHLTFCSVSCSNKYRTRSEESKQKTSFTLKKSSKLHWITCKHEECSNIVLKSRNRPVYCKECLGKNLADRGSSGGKKSASIQSDARRSKPEKAFFALLKERYPDATHNTVLFDGWDADIVIPSIKTTIHWNGRWHYEKISRKHSVLQVQNRDFLKTKTFEENGWKSIHIRDLQDKKPDLILKPVLEHISKKNGSCSIF